MSWNFRLRCKDAELDTKVKEIIRNQAAAKENPASARAFRQIQEHALGSLHSMPKDSMITVESSGHYDATGQGQHDLTIRVETSEALALKAQFEAEADARRKAVEAETFGQPVDTAAPVAGEVFPQLGGVDQDAPQ